MRGARIKCVTYAGRTGWVLRKKFSKYTSRAYLSVQYVIRKRLYKKYIDAFNAAAGAGDFFMPCLISIETINRCNGGCEFCPANRSSETRPFARMEEGTFHKIIKELAELNYSGYLNLYVNNEPFMDMRIEEWYRYAKERLPRAKMLLYTNGTLITRERFIKIIPWIDKMIINNYCGKFKLHENVANLYEYVKCTPALWDKDITIQIRYTKEILTNRAGTAPNRLKMKHNNRICIMPFTDFTVYPEGTVGLCCSDALERTNYGNLNNQSLYEIWTSDQYGKLRAMIGKNRSNYKFCEGCDFVDAGIRNEMIKGRLEDIDK